ncbi:hypothetical protein ISF_07089 [Cordyceps fumosorosea ARSEF 2679]|uniref:NAD dependent epimerase/dehydratase n=1 Tax=Cordyceps fumosorosea (strain ARSEF 2679) TaxID=1081104 RepID=A0A167PZV0_CORFA|nr:hypothetical protein ISF_07089 [Cordyceps fumosorosea ARSEF 2679]OAA57168.1 hypothetical protein ISF_07089 [Cordyceps fumosorosea ARSEF 2679]
MGGVPSVPRDKSRSIQVIAAGYSRTGTTSISIALERLLDGPVFHGGNQIFQREDAFMREWCRMIDADGDAPEMRARLRRITAGYAAIADAPAYLLLPELLALYPDARVVLVTRDRARWYRSMAPIMRSVSAPPMRLLEVLLWPCPGWRWLPHYLQWAGRREEKRIGIEFTPGNRLPRVGKMNHRSNIMADMLDKHNDWVRRNVPPDRFLEMDLSEGWSPLADFLGVPVPDEPFPRANDAAEADAVTRRILTTAALTWTGILATTAAVAWQARHLWRTR